MKAEELLAKEVTLQDHPDLPRDHHIVDPEVEVPKEKGVIDPPPCHLGHQGPDHAGLDPDPRPPKVFPVATTRKVLTDVPKVLLVETPHPFKRGCSIWPHPRRESLKISKKNQKIRKNPSVSARPILP